MDSRFIRLNATEETVKQQQHFTRFRGLIFKVIFANIEMRTIYAFNKLGSTDINSITSEHDEITNNKDAYKISREHRMKWVYIK